MELIHEFDRIILYWIQENLGCGFCDKFFVIATWFGEKGIFWLSTSIIMLFFKKTRKCGFITLFAIGFAFLLSQGIIKNIVGRVRPFEFFDWDTSLLLVKIPLDSSFPSSHSCVSFSAATSIFINNKKFGIAALIIAALVAFSRLYLFVHFPTDVITGIILGIVVAITVNIVANSIIKKRAEKSEVQASE